MQLEPPAVQPGYDLRVEFFLNTPSFPAQRPAPRPGVGNIAGIPRDHVAMAVHHDLAGIIRIIVGKISCYKRIIASCDRVSNNISWMCCHARQI